MYCDLVKWEVFFHLRMHLNHNVAQGSQTFHMFYRITCSGSPGHMHLPICPAIGSFCCLSLSLLAFVSLSISAFWLLPLDKAFLPVAWGHSASHLDPKWGQWQGQASSRLCYSTSDDRAPSLLSFPSQTLEGKGLVFFSRNPCGRWHQICQFWLRKYTQKL